MLDSAGNGSAGLLAFQRIGGITVARQQAVVALELGCERIVCIASQLADELIEVQHLAETSGARFNVVGDALALVGLVRANDEVIVLEDGLFATAAQVAELIEPGQAIVVQPEGVGLSNGFQRIDAENAFGGAMRLPGRLVERLADLPRDCDAVAALLRIGLQAGVRRIALPLNEPGLLWEKVRSEEQAHALEPLWIRQRTQDYGALGPSSFIALAGVRSFGPALLHAGSGGRGLMVAAGVLMFLALGAGWLGQLAIAFAVLGLAWLLCICGDLLGRIEREAAVRRGKRVTATFALLADVIVMWLGAWGGEMHTGQHFVDRMFPAFMLVAMARILPRLLAGRVAAWIEDRALLAFALAAASVAGYLAPTIHVAAALAALVAIAVPLGQSRITRA